MVHGDTCVAGWGLAPAGSCSMLGVHSLPPCVPFSSLASRLRFPRLHRGRPLHASPLGGFGVGAAQARREGSRSPELHLSRLSEGLGGQMKGAARLSCGPAREQRAAADQRQGRAGVNRGLSPPLPPPVKVPEEMAAAPQSVITAEAGGRSGPGSPRPVACATRAQHPRRGSSVSELTGPGKRFQGGGGCRVIRSAVEPPPALGGAKEPLACLPLGLLLPFLFPALSSSLGWVRGDSRAGEGCALLAPPRPHSRRLSLGLKDMRSHHPAPVRPCGSLLRVLTGGLPEEGVEGWRCRGGKGWQTPPGNGDPSLSRNSERRETSAQPCSSANGVFQPKFPSWGLAVSVCDLPDGATVQIPCSLCFTAARDRLRDSGHWRKVRPWPPVSCSLLPSPITRWPPHSCIPPCIHTVDLITN